MNSDSHRRISELFEQAVDLPHDKWDEFVEIHCRDNEELRRPLLDLLEAERQAPDSFLAQPAIQATARQLAEKAASLPGTQLGPYRLENQVGFGGMGTVYQAYDARLDRRVAIKLLPPAFMSDPERIARFRKEARSASQLNHLNIVSVYDAEFDHGRYYIATEFVEGQTLRKLTAGRPLEIRQLIDIGIQICSALGAAHDTGIVHRDIKPENVMLRPDGVVKVLDFGLAKLYEPGSGDHPITLETRPGSIAGTVQYLSPEQILGKPAGPRSDIFSVGVVLFELATGVRPFNGATDGAIYAAILQETPPCPSALRAGIDAGLDSLLLRALEKDPALRFQTIGDLGSALKRLQRDSTPSAHTRIHPPAPRRQLPNWLPWSLAAAAVVLGAGSFLIRPRPPAAIPVAFQQLTSGGEDLHPSLSPDGQQLIFSSRKNGNWDVYLKRVGGETEINLTRDSPADDLQPAFSPDGKSIAFRSSRQGGGLFLMEPTGENPRRVSKAGFYPSWAPDSRKIVYSECDFQVPSERKCYPSRLAILDLASQSVQPLTAVIDGIQPAWSPHGDRIAFWGIPGDGGGRRIYTVARAGGSVIPIAKVEGSGLDWNPVWAPSGDGLYFVSARGGTMNLWRVPIDEKSGQAKGEPEPVTTPSLYVRGISMGRDESQFIFTRSRMQVDLFSVEIDPVQGSLTSAPAVITKGPVSVSNFSLSPDEKRIVFDTLTDSQENLWLMNVDGTGRRRLTTGMHKDRAPAWSPRGEEIAFYSDRAAPEADNYDVWVINADGGGLHRVTALENESQQSPGWTPDGSRVLIHPSRGRPAQVDPAAVMQKQASDRLPGLENFGFTYFPVWHGNFKRWIGRTATKRSGHEIFLYDPVAGKAEVLGVTGEEPHLLPGERQFLFFRDSECFLYDLDHRRERKLFSISPHEFFSLGLTRDGRRLYFTQANREGEIWQARMKER